jgi:2-amino-4-hydroxy-6-hydroxymethyldihydropteridine diphosphokinase
MRSGGGSQNPPIEPVDVYLSLGSNLGDRRKAIERGLSLLGQRGVSIVRRSSVYETEPTDFGPQPWFLNLVVEGKSRLSARDLLRVSKEIEGELDRRPERRFGPRSLDVDILLYGRETIEGEDLIVPHPRMRRRRFVLVPLVEIAPELTDPGDGRRFDAMLHGLDEGKKVVRLASTES